MKLYAKVRGRLRRRAGMPRVGCLFFFFVEGLLHRQRAWERQRRQKYAIMAPMNFPALVRFRRFSQNKRRGFTLIEIAIAMVVIGVLLGAVVPTMRALEERRQFKNENSRMETIRDAIIGYAIRNRTRARTIEFVPYPDGNLALPPWVFHLPAGRPYLPCPDWDGDAMKTAFPKDNTASRRGLKSTQFGHYRHNLPSAAQA